MEWNIIVGLVCTVLGAVISYATFSRGKGKDDRSDGRQIGTVLTELGYIKSNTDEIKAEQREQRKVNTTVEGRLAAADHVNEASQFGGGWALWDPDFRAEGIFEQTKLQCWTLKPAIF